MKEISLKRRYLKFCDLVRKRRRIIGNIFWIIYSHNVEKVKRIRLQEMREILATLFKESSMAEKERKLISDQTESSF